MSTQESLPTTPDAPMGDRSIEVAPQFFPTPERVSQFLEMETEKVAVGLQSVEGRNQLFQALLEHEEHLRELDPSFNPEKLRTQLDLVGEVLREKGEYMKDITSPEKKGLFRRTWERVKGFAKSHPIVMALLVAAGLVAAVAGAYYLAANIEGALHVVGLEHLYGKQGAAEAVRQGGRILGNGEGTAEAITEGLGGGTVEPGL